MAHSGPKEKTVTITSSVTRIAPSGRENPHVVRSRCEQNAEEIG
jgi:hypothetical protein